MRAVRRARLGSSRARLGVTLVAHLAAALAIVVMPAGPADAGPPPVMFGYVPMRANDMQGAMESISASAGPVLDFTVGLTNAGAGAVLYYDQWEDGYEADIANPVQSTTRVFGDGSSANGDAAAFCGACAGDALPQGASLIMRNNVTTPRTSAPVLFDGGDKVASTRGFAITAGGFTTDLGSLLAGVVSAYDTSKYSSDYTVPVGEDTPVPAGTSDAFAYSGVVVQAARDGTVVEVDSDADGTVDTSGTIDEGETFFADGGVLEGATVHASAPVQAHLATGDTSATYESRWFTLFPDSVLTGDYMSVAGSNVSNFRTVNFLYNPSDAAISVTPTCASCSGTINVGANASAAFHSPLGEAVRFASSGGAPFIAIAGVGAQSGAAPGGGSDASSSWDWGFTMVPSSQLTSQVVLGWAPGNSTNPPSGAPVGNRDDDPVWVTTLSATTVRVDFDGDPGSGSIVSADCFGARHDLDLSVAALASTRIFDSNDGDMTGARIYTCDGTLISGAWGEDPANAPTGSPGFDAGYTIIPTTTMIVDKTAAIAIDANADGQFSPGDRITYDISIADAGSLAFTNVNASDVLPSGSTYVPGSTEFDDGSTVTPIPDDIAPPAATPFPLDEAGASLPIIAAGSTVHLSFDVVVDDPYQVTSTVLGNTACVTATEAATCDSVETELAEADLSLTKTEIANPQHLGDDATFRIAVHNAGPDTATGVEVTDVLPAGMTFVSASESQGVYDDLTGVWSVGTLTNGASASVDITATIDGLSVENFAEITAAQAADPDSQPSENALGSGAAPDQDDEDSHAISVAPLADLSLTKTSSPATVDQMNEATFTLTLANAGPSDATGVAVTDLLPSGVTFVSAAESQGSYNPVNGLWSIGTVPTGDSVTLDITVVVVDAGTILNTAEVTAVNEDDPDSAPNNADATEDDLDSAALSSDPLVDLSVDKSVSAATAQVGSSVTYTITVANDGPSTASGVLVEDELPTGVTYVSDIASAGSYDSGTGAWTVGSLSNGASETLEITVTVSAAETIDNYVQVSDTNEIDVDSQPDENALGAGNPPDQDDEAAVALTGVLVDLELDIAADDTTVNVGDTVTYTITLTNAGPSAATGVAVQDVLPPGVTYLGSTPSAGLFDPVSGTWTVGDLDSGDTVTLDVNVRVDEAGPITNLAEVSGANEPDVDSTPSNGDATEDDQDAVTVSGVSADLSLEKRVDEPRPDLGSVVTYTLVVTNQGPSNATNVVVVDRLPAGTSFISAPGSYSPSTHEWTITSLANGASASIDIRVRVNKVGTIVNAAAIDEADQPDPDSTPGNDNPHEDDWDSATITAQTARLAGTVWLDRDGNARFDAGEPALPDILVALFDEAGAEIRSARTNRNGDYAFANLPPQRYTIVLDRDTLPALVAGQSYDPDAVLDSRHSVTLVAGDNLAAIDFGFEPVAPVPPAQPPDASPASLARTGFDGARILTVAALLLVVGTLAVVSARRRRKRTAARS